MKKILIQLFFTCVVVINATQIPGTAIDIVPPKGFTLTDRFPGFLNSSTGGSIMVTTIAVEFSQMVDAFSNKEYLQSQQMTFLKKSELNVSGRQAKLVHLSQEAGGLNWEKWSTIVDCGDSIIMITATFLANTDESIKNELKNCVQNANVVRAQDPMNSLLFTVDPIDPFQLVKIMGQNMIFAFNGQFPVKENGDPYILLGLSMTENYKIEDQNGFATKRMLEVKDMNKIVVRKKQPVTINGLSGFEIIADAVDKTDNIPSTLYQTILFDTDGYVMIYGTTRKVEEKKYLPIMQKMANSFKMKNL